MATKYKVKVTLAAKTDLDEIFSYISETLFAEQTAMNLMREIDKTIRSLDEVPHRYSYSLDKTLAAKGYRRALVKSYVILYLIDETKNIVNIARVFHGSQDYKKYV